MARGWRGDGEGMARGCCDKQRGRPCSNSVTHCCRHGWNWLRTWEREALAKQERSLRLGGRIGKNPTVTAKPASQTQCGMRSNGCRVYWRGAQHTKCKLARYEQNPAHQQHGSPGQPCTMRCMQYAKLFGIMTEALPWRAGLPSAPPSGLPSELPSG